MSGLTLGARRHDNPSPAGGYRLTGECPCRDLVADAIEIVLSFLTDHGGALTNPPGAVRKHLRYRMIDLHRHARCELGAQAKPETVAENRYGRALPDDFHRALYVMVVDEAGIRGPLRGRAGLLRRLADRCGKDFGGEARRRLPAALRLIERTCQSGPRVNVGTRTEPELVTWWEAYIERPLGRRFDPASVGDTPTDVADPTAPHAFDHVLSAVAAGLDVNGESAEDIVARTVRTTVESAHDEDVELQRTVTALGERDLLPRARVRSLLADTRQREQVITCVHRMRGAQ
jgi:hypothetical protein